MKILVNLLIFLIFLGNICFSQQCLKDGIFLPSMPPCKAGSYYLAFEDNFNGNTLDLSTWGIQPHSQGAFYNDPNSLNQEYNSLDNVVISNGTCKIVAKQETVFRRAVSYKGDNEIVDDGYPNLRVYNYTSSNIWTHQDFSYGKYEVRCKLPAGKGFWPAFWTFGGQRWNEIDIIDNLEGTQRYSCGPGYDYDGDGQAEGCRFGTNNIPDLSQWHTYTCIYEFDRIIWQIDGVDIRTFYRYTTSTNIPITCGENIANGVYFQEQSFPIDKMHIILNLAIRNGNSAPDNSTVLPNYFEIDYVRYYIKIQGTPCDDCIDQITYENTSQLPSLTTAKRNIFLQNGVSVLNGQSVTMYAGEKIVLSPGFKSHNGSNFKASIRECNFLNHNSNPINYIGNNAINGYQILKCINPVYSVEVSNATSYSLKVYNLQSQLIYTATGNIQFNHLNLWNTFSYATGWYSIRLELNSCSDSKVIEHNLSIDYGNCRVSSAQNDTLIDENNSSQNIIKIPVSVYPNPAKNELNIYVPQYNKNTLEVFLIDIYGKEVLRKTIVSKEGLNTFKLKLNDFSNGVYYLTILSEEDLVAKEKIVITK